MSTHHSYNEFHLGDNLIHLHFLRKLALKYPEESFVHAVHPCHIAQLAEVVEDLPNIRLIHLEDKVAASVNVWKNAGGFWEQHQFRNNFAWFYLAWFDHLARGMGLENPVKEYKDLWFDYPRIIRASDRVADCLGALTQKKGLRFDFLIVNSRPCSGQFRAYDSTEYLTPLIEELALRYSVAITQPLFIEGGSRVVHPTRIACTMDYGLTISEVGNLSLHADNLIMVSTGPSWPTFNVWNANNVRLRLLMLDTEIIDYMPNLIQVGNREAAREVLRARGFL